MICCVKVGTRYGDEYVLRLRDGVRRHLPEYAKDTRFVCFTDKPPVEGVECEPAIDLPKWWAKLGLYKLKQPLIYFDLDIVILGSLKPLLDWQGFGVLKNPWLKGYNSSVLKLTGNEGHVWDRFTPGVMTAMRGDQDWLNVAMPGAPVFPVEWFPSWKVHRLFTLDAPPKGAIAAICHGSPKPHQVRGWLNDHWIGTAQ